MNENGVGRAEFRWDMLAAVFCFLFGLALIANTQPDGDGLWFWYSEAVLHGQKLYTNLHLNLQPLFILTTASFLGVLGPGWLAFKVWPALQALLYCGGLLLVVRSLPLRSWQRGLLLTAVFGMTITTSFYRFDDYHVTTQILQVFALALLLRLPAFKANGALGATIALGLLCGLSTSNRLNDGAALYVACFSAIPFLLPAKKIRGLLLLTVFTAVGLFTMVLLTGDTIAAWHLESITLASRIKGGTGSILLAPLGMPYRLTRAMLGVWNIGLLGTVAVLLVLLKRYPLRLERGTAGSRINAALAALLIAASILWLIPGARGKSNATLGLVISLALLAAGVWVYWSMLRGFNRTDWNRNATLVLVPFWGLVGAALTSGVVLPDYEPNAAIFLLVVPFVFTSLYEVAWQRGSLMLVCWLIAIAFIPAKILVPYQWHHYHADPMFADRTLYRHPVFGPMVIEKAQLDFMRPMCDTIHSSTGTPSLLALPYPYPNYFCDIPPWHGYVQTWYDTSGKETVGALEGELATAPPQWIMYQRGLDTMVLHESVIVPKPILPQRELDREVMQKIEADQWTIARRVCFEGSDWLLIRTTPPGAGEHHGEPDDATDRHHACFTTEADLWVALKRHYGLKQTE